jgi:hypothetical protein
MAKITTKLVETASSVIDPDVRDGALGMVPPILDAQVAARNERDRKDPRRVVFRNARGNAANRARKIPVTLKKLSCLDDK